MIATSALTLTELDQETNGIAGDLLNTEIVMPVLDFEARTRFIWAKLCDTFCACNISSASCREIALNFKYAPEDLKANIRLCSKVSLVCPVFYITYFAMLTNVRKRLVIAQKICIMRSSPLYAHVFLLCMKNEK